MSLKMQSKDGEVVCTMSGGVWHSLVPDSEHAPSTRSKHACCALGSHIYLLAGRNGNLPLRDFWKFNLARGTWHEIKARGDVPPCLQEHTMVAWRDKLYVFGGEVGFSGGSQTPLWCYHTKLNEWRKLSQYPEDSTSGTRNARRVGGSSCRRPLALRGHSAVVHDHFMYVYGGYRDLKGSIGELWRFCFESSAWSEISTVNGPCSGRHCHSAVMQDGCMWVFAGMTDLHEKADLWKLDLVSLHWTQWRCRGLAPAVRHGHVSSRVLSWMLVYGGQSRGHATHELWRFHFVTENWERVLCDEPQPQARSQCAAVVISASIWTTTVPPSSAPSTAVPVVHADVLRHRAAGRRSTSAKTSVGTSGCLLSRFMPANLTYLRQPSYSALSNGSCDSIEMHQLTARTSAIDMSRSISSHAVPAGGGGTMNSERVSFPDLLDSSAGVHYMINETATSDGGGAECDRSSDYSSIEHCDISGFDNPNYSSVATARPPVCRMGAPPSLPLCCSQDSGISDRALVSPCQNAANSGTDSGGVALVAADSCDPARLAYFPVFVYVVGGREALQVTGFKRPVSLWRLQLT